MAFVGCLPTLAYVELLTLNCVRISARLAYVELRKNCVRIALTADHDFLQQLWLF